MCTRNATPSMTRIIFIDRPLLPLKNLVNQKSSVLRLQNGPNVSLYPYVKWCALFATSQTGIFVQHE